MAQIENDGFVFLTCVGGFFLCVYVCVQSKQPAVTNVPVAVGLD